MFFYIFFNFFFFKKNALRKTSAFRYISAARCFNNLHCGKDCSEVSGALNPYLLFKCYLKNNIVFVSLFCSQRCGFLTSLNFLLGVRLVNFFFFNLAFKNLTNLALIILSKKKKYFFFLDKIISARFVKFLINNKIVYFSLGVRNKYDFVMFFNVFLKFFFTYYIYKKIF